MNSFLCIQHGLKKYLLPFEGSLAVMADALELCKTLDVNQLENRIEVSNDSSNEFKEGQFYTERNVSISEYQNENNDWVMLADYKPYEEMPVIEITLPDWMPRAVDIGVTVYHYLFRKR